MKDVFVEKLRGLDGFIWIADDQLLIWTGKRNVGVVLTSVSEIYFDLRESLPGGRLVFFDRKMRKGFEDKVDTTMKAVLLDEGKLKRLKELDERGERWAKRIM